MKKPFLALILTVLAGLPMLFMGGRDAEAIRLSKQMIDVEQRWEETVNSTASSTTSVTGFLLSYAVAAYGAEVSYTIHFTSVTRRVDNAIAPQISSSSIRTVRDGDTVSEEIKTIMKDPSIVIHALDTAATVHVILSYGVPGTN